MCLAIPGKIIEIKEDLATVDYGSEKRQAKIIQGSIEGGVVVGDFVIVQGKIVIEKVPEEQVQKWLELVEQDNNAA